MKSFAIAIFLLLSQVVSAQFGLDTRGMKRRNLQEGSMSFGTAATSTFQAKSHKKAKTSKVGKTYKGESMSYYMPYPPSATSLKTSSSSDAASTENSVDTPAAPKSKGDMKHKGSSSQKTASSSDVASTANSADTPDAPKSKGATTQKGSAKSKEGATPNSESSKKSQKGLDMTKFTRSSLKPIDGGVESTESETANTLSSANAENSASAYGVKGAFIVAMCFAVAGALIAA